MLSIDFWVIGLVFAAPRIRSQVQRCETLIVVIDAYKSILPPGVPGVFKAFFVRTKKALKTPGRNVNGKRRKRGSTMMKKRLELKDIGDTAVNIM